MKTYQAFINERVYYNSHGNFSSFFNIRQLEETERENYPKGTFDSWAEQYGISDDDSCIWVTKDKKQAYTYLLPSQYHDEIMSKEEWEVEEWIDDKRIEEKLYEVDDKDGYIIPESDDGDGGFLFVKDN
jgi:hypothetical protein